jgi:hypothetical protein
MRHFTSFLANFLFLLLFVILISVFCHFRIDGQKGLWLLYSISQDLLLYLPLTAALGILWGLVVRDKSEAQLPVPVSVTTLFVILYILVMIASAFLFQELLIPKIYEQASYRDMLQDRKIEVKDKIKDTTGEKFKMSEFDKLPMMEARQNIAFMIGSSLVYFEKMYDGNGAYYIEGFRFIAYNTNQKLDYILTSRRAKWTEGEILTIDPVYTGYTSGNQISQVKTIQGIKKVPVSYSADAAFHLSSDHRVRHASLVRIFMHNDYIYGSNLNLYRIGNIVFNKIAYYIILIVLLVTASAVGMRWRNQRLVGKDFFPLVCFYVVTFLSMVLFCDILYSLANMVYGLVV